MKLWNYNGEQNTISGALSLRLPEHAVVSVIGAGGKTTLILAWARELAGSGKKVSITTTTHMYSPERMARDGLAVPDGVRFAAAPDPDDPEKVVALSAEEFEELRRASDVTLIEADGARGMPLKWPAAWEPVVPESSDATVCVAGLSAVGKKTADSVYRASDLPDRLQRDVVDHNFLHALISSREGGRKGACGEFRVFLNQVDDDTDRLAAAYRLQQIFSVMGIQTAWGSLQDGSESRAAENGKSPSPLQIAIILEAAGNSTRFGSNKLMHIMEDGRPMAACTMDAVSDAIGMFSRMSAETRPAFKKILVTQYEEVAALAPDFEVVMNEHPELGISRSMQLGIEAAGDVDAYLFCVCDQPGLTAGSIAKLIRRFAETAPESGDQIGILSEGNKKETAGIVSLAWKGAMCNPKIFSSEYKDELMSLRGDTGGRQIIEAHADELVLVEAGSVSETLDIDSL